MMHAGDGVGMWDEEDGFFYDVLRLPDGQAERLKVRSMVGLLPLCAVTVFDGELLERYPEFEHAAAAIPRSASGAARRSSTTRRHAGRAADAWPRSSTRPSSGGSWRGCSTRRSSSARTASGRCRGTTRDHPYVFARRRRRSTASATCRPNPTAGCSAATRTGAARSGCPSTRCSSGRCSSTTRYYGDDFTVECPTGSGQQMNLYEVAEELGRRLARDLPARRRRAATGLRRRHEVPGRSALARPAPVLRVLPRRQRRRARREPPDGLDGRHRRAMHPCSRRPPVTTCCDWARWSLRANRRRRRPGARHRGCLIVASPAYPALYQINTRVWLTELLARARSAGDARRHPGQRDSTPWRAPGFDWVWLLSVWQTGPAGRQVSRDDPDLRAEFQRTLPDLQRGRHRGLRLRDHRVHRRGHARRRRGAGAAPRAAARTRASG